MNIIDAISDMREAYSPESDRAKLYPSWLAVGELVASYDALAPDWDSAPDDAVAYAIDANGEANWFPVDVQVTPNASFWGVLMDRGSDAGFVELPIGIDWRLCKWSRKQVKS